MIERLAFITTLFVALEHLGIVYLEMVLWAKPAGRKIFKLTPEMAQQTAHMGANQGLYNGFLAAALLLSLFYFTGPTAMAFRYYGLVCVVVAGLYGAYSVSPRILIIQSVPAALAILLTALT